jgi:hypothetical protein
MGESKSHMHLVELLAEWIATNLLEGDYEHMLIDFPDRPAQRKPPKIYGYIPDIYISHSSQYSLIIGEAKTASDIESRHTIDQINSYLRRCAQSDRALLVMAVPWFCVGGANSTIRYCKNKTGFTEVKSIVIEKLSS